MAEVKPDEKVTLNDVAEMAGVSSAAASLAIRGKPGVAEETRRRVLDVAADLGYRGRSADSTQGTIGVLIKSGPVDVGATNAFYGPVLAGIMEAATAAELDVRIDNLAVDEHFNVIDMPRLMNVEDTQGLLVLGAFLSDSAADMLGTRPVVLVDGYAADPSRFSSVVSDNAGGASAATRAMIEAGHRDIAFIGATDGSFPSILERRAGYEATMAQYDLEPRIVDASHEDPIQCGEAAVAVTKHTPSVTGFVCANDAVALEVHAALGDRVPHEISVSGFDDIEPASFVRPPLTSVLVDKLAMGRIAVSMLRHRMHHPSDPTFTTVQRATLVPRGSIAPISR